ncbi:MAG: MAPEG family protein [Alphaproteobacteria bacterium]|nr:MAPEG family protein [Alphaproteobacteria bacterium]
MTTEIHWMLLTVLMTALFWLPYILDRIAVRGLIRAVADDRPETGEHHSLWAKRAMRAHANAIENLAIFVPAVLALHALNISTPATQSAAAAYFAARLIHFVVYTGGVPYIRTLAFAAGWVAQVVLIATALGWM